MHVPVWPTLPSSNLPAGALAQKFNVASLSGLGCDCTLGENVYANTGECLDGTDCEVGVDTTIPPITDTTPTMGPPPLPPLAAGTTDTVSLDSYFASLGVQPPAPGQVIAVPTTNGGTTYVQNTGTQQNPNYAPVIGAAVQGAISLAKLMTIQPGTTLSPTGAISRQTAGVPLNTTAVNSTIATPGISGTTMMLIAAVAAVALIAGGKK